MEPPCRFRDLTGHGYFQGSSVARFGRDFVVTCSNNAKAHVERLCKDATSQRDIEWIFEDAPQLELE